MQPASACHSRVRCAWSAYPLAAATRRERDPAARRPQRPAAPGCAENRATRWYSFGVSPHSARTTRAQVPPAVADLVGDLLHALTPRVSRGQRPPDLGARLGGAVPGQRRDQRPLDDPHPRRPGRGVGEPLGQVRQLRGDVVELERSRRRASAAGTPEQRPGAGGGEVELDPGLVAVVVDLRGPGVQPGHARPARRPRRRPHPPTRRRAARPPAARTSAPVDGRPRCTPGPPRSTSYATARPDVRRQGRRQPPVFHGPHGTAHGLR